MTYAITSICIILKNELFRNLNAKVRHDFIRTFSKYRSIKMAKLIPPNNVRGMVKLDREKFKATIEIFALKINENHLSDVMKYAKKYLLKMENLKPVQTLQIEEENVQDVKYKYALLDPNKINCWEDLNKEDRNCIEKWNLNETNCFVKHKIELNYENWSSEDILKSILPEGNDNVTSFSKVGHIVHLNLRDANMQYKNIIGQVMLDKVNNCKTVINKTTSIDNTYRNFNLELLAGEKNYLTAVKENKCTFEFDFSLVYWNPRLCTEHERITNKLKAGDYLFDVFSGVGPFALPAAKNKCIVYANDLNPESYKWLLHNAKLNKIKDNLKCFNMDGREFIKNVFVKNYVQFLIDYNDGKIREKTNVHLTMNLPAMAVEFLDVFKGSIKDIPSSIVNFNDPILHVYCFAFGDTPSQTSVQMVEQNLGINLSEECLIEVFNVRNVSPKKEMMRVSFRLPHSHLLDSTDCVAASEISAKSVLSNKRKCSVENEVSDSKCLKL